MVVCHRGPSANPAFEDREFASTNALEQARSGHRALVVTAGDGKWPWRQVTLLRERAEFDGHGARNMACAVFRSLANIDEWRVRRAAHQRDATLVIACG